ncbi:hypothetical protein EVJ58_g3105 [Rhodofomes roseus]|uniref:DUF6533 domain-containing protein n=1 Tax=Rhodofomes roseus TaxID=34475 RepID=A0A4Y9YM94_9APHY|nr:hypothetical protein EVJ58_g3105 [Rhodofomes roseus]
MSQASQLTILIPAAWIPYYEGGFYARLLALAGFIWIVYDYLLTLEDEIEYFWAGPWSISRALFFWATFVTDYIGITVVQAIIVVRVWYIYSGRLLARVFVLGVFLASIVISAREFAAILPSVHFEVDVSLPFRGCPAPPITGVWTIFLPYLVTQTILFVATMWPVVNLRRQGRYSQVMGRLVRDGCVFYFAFFVGAAFTTIGSIQKGDVSLLYTAVFSNFLLAVSSVSVSRLILSIRSLASQLSIDPDTLLSTAELSRITWKRGAYDGEIVVEINTIEEDSYDMDELEHSGRSSTPGFYTTQVQQTIVQGHSACLPSITQDGVHMMIRRLVHPSRLERVTASLMLDDVGHDA